MDRGDRTNLDELWAAASRALPTFSREEQRAGLALFAELSKGLPVTLARLARILDARIEAVEALVGDSALISYVDMGDRARIDGFLGLATTPTPHRFTVDRRKLWTWCAYDTLFLPELLGVTAEVETRDPETAEPIRLTVSPSGIEAAEPAGIVASIVRTQLWELGSSARLRGSACRFMHFFASRTSAERWQARHSGVVLLPLDDAFVFGKRSNAHRFGTELARRAHQAA